MRRTRMVNHKEDGVYDLELGTLAIGLIVALFTFFLTGGGWMIVNQIQLGRELVDTRGDVKSIHSEIAIRVEQRDREHAELVKADEDAAQRVDAIAESLASIEYWLASFRETSESNQQHALSILEKLPVQKEKRQ